MGLHNESLFRSVYFQMILRYQCNIKYGLPKYLIILVHKLVSSGPETIITSLRSQFMPAKLRSKCFNGQRLILRNLFFLNSHLRARYALNTSVFKNGPSPTSFSLFSSFQYTVDSKKMFNINKFLLMTGFEMRTSGIGSNLSTNWATTTA